MLSLFWVEGGVGLFKPEILEELGKVAKFVEKRHRARQNFGTSFHSLKLGRRNMGG